MAKHCAGCSHPTICCTHGCAADEAKRNKAAPAPLPRVSGVSRDAECPKALVVFFQREPTDDEMRALHELLRAHGA